MAIIYQKQTPSLTDSVNSKVLSNYIEPLNLAISKQLLIQMKERD